ncbi:hypothetical protein AMELA_G00033010 [Ameiurus melas]|uniref:Uncharacterized protein n=1 Tax=Ameiurus melas TaxID=219545 RepID=A0A7J6BAL7_AMEME|nr:hypothetical protein AMELA_G00033010 [Ameiurus melas]
MRFLKNKGKAPSIPNSRRITTSVALAEGYTFLTSSVCSGSRQGKNVCLRETRNLPRVDILQKKINHPDIDFAVLQTRIRESYTPIATPTAPSRILITKKEL